MTKATKYFSGVVGAVLMCSSPLVQCLLASSEHSVRRVWVKSRTSNPSTHSDSCTALRYHHGAHVRLAFIYKRCPCPRNAAPGSPLQAERAHRRTFDYRDASGDERR